MLGGGRSYEGVLSLDDERTCSSGERRVARASLGDADQQAIAAHAALTSSFTFAFPGRWLVALSLPSIRREDVNWRHSS